MKDNIKNEIELEFPHEVIDTPSKPVEKGDNDTPSKPVEKGDNDTPSKPVEKGDNDTPSKPVEHPPLNPLHKKLQRNFETNEIISLEKILSPNELIALNNMRDYEDVDESDILRASISHFLTESYTKIIDKQNELHKVLQNAITQTIEFKESFADSHIKNEEAIEAFGEEKKEEINNTAFLATKFITRTLNESHSAVQKHMDELDKTADSFISNFKIKLEKSLKETTFTKRFFIDRIILISLITIAMIATQFLLFAIMFN